jgi:integrase
VRFPATVRHRTGKVKIYAPGKKYSYYRISFTVAGQRHMQTFRTYPEAREVAEKKAKEIHSNSFGASLSPTQAQDAFAAFEKLKSLPHPPGVNYSLLGAVSDFVEATKLVGGRSLREVAEAYMRNTAVVKPYDILKAVNEFLESRRHKSETEDGKRAQMSPIYASNVRTWLTDFAGTFPGTAVRDLTKDHLNVYIQKHKEHSPKNRNDRRSTVKMFLIWATKQDYLSTTHRLFEAGGMERESVNTGETTFYKPTELQRFLDNSSDELRAAIAICGLAGLRVEEVMRLNWEDVWRIKGHIEIKAGVAKTRARRLVNICPALAAWLKPHRNSTGKVYPSGVNYFQEKFTDLRSALNIPIQRNGLRHGFCSCHFALHSNENLTAAQAGNSPQMIHKHYKGLVTKAGAKKWFAVMPTKTEISTAT